MNYKYLHRETSGWHFCLFYSIMLPLQLFFTCFGGAEVILMDNKNHDTITFAVSLIFKVAIVVFLVNVYGRKAFKASLTNSA